MTIVFRILLLGLAVPIQAVIIPIFYLISKAGFYDTLPAVILPTAAFAIPISTIVMTGSMRDITPDMYEAMALDGASSLAHLPEPGPATLPGRPGDDHHLLGASGLERVPVPVDPDAVCERQGLHTGPV